MYHVAHKVLMRFLFWKNVNLVIGLSLRFRFTFRIHFHEQVGYHSCLSN